MASLGDVLHETRETLSKAEIPDARLEAEVLLTNLMKVPRHRIYAFQEEEVSDQHQKVLAGLLERRLKREPLAYILGHKEFYGVDLAVAPGAMIPRPETEQMVEQALFLSMLHMEEVDWVIAEPGTGCGAISIALAIHLPMARIYATERSDKAAQVAAYNIQRHNVADRVTLIHGDLLEQLPELADIIVANLPYIPSDNIASLQPEVRWEPQEALDGGPDGLDIIRNLLQQAPEKIKDRGVILLEIDPGQAEPLEVLTRSLFPQATITTQQDLAHLDRYFVVELATTD